jgi:adenylate cyclase
VTLVVALAAIGFPAVIILAWAFEVTPEGLQRTPSSDGDFAPATSKSRVVEFALIFGLIAALGYLYATRLTPELPNDPSAVSDGAPTFGTPGPPDGALVADLANRTGKRSIAVLPFVNMSRDPENEYFSDGISEEILDALANRENLRVAARTSSFSFKNKTQDVREIAAMLSVETILEGSVRKAGNRVRITAQLINAETGFHLWSQTFDRELLDIFAVQEEISRSIVAALNIPLGLAATDALVHPGTANAEAYNLYLRGLHHFSEIGPENYRKAIDAMQRAIAIDPEFAKPYGVVAAANMIAALWLPRDVAFPAAKSAFDRALELDPTLSLALVAKAQYVTLTEWDWRATRSYFDRALEDQSELTMAAFAFSALHLMPLGQTAAADALLVEAESRDPLDTRIKILRGTVALFTGRPAEALAFYEAAIDIDENSMQASSALCSARVLLGDVAGAERLLADWHTRLGSDHPWLLACRTFAALASGDFAAGGAAYQKLAAAASEQPGLAFFDGDVALQLGQVDEALGWYVKSLEDGEVAILMTRLRHANEPILAAHPGYQALLRRLNLDDASVASLVSENAEI